MSCFIFYKMNKGKIVVTTISLGDSLIVQFQLTRLQLNKPNCMFSSFLLFFSSFLVFLSSSCLSSTWMILVLMFLSLCSYHLVSFPNQDNVNIFSFLYIDYLQIFIFKIVHFKSLWYQWGPGWKRLEVFVFLRKPNQKKILAESKR